MQVNQAVVGRRPAWFFSAASGVLILLLLPGCRTYLQTYPGPALPDNETARLSTMYYAVVPGETHHDLGLMYLDGMPLESLYAKSSYAGIAMLPGRHTITGFIRVWSEVPGSGRPTGGRGVVGWAITLKGVPSKPFSLTFEAKAGHGYWLQRMPHGERLIQAGTNWQPYLCVVISDETEGQIVARTEGGHLASSWSVDNPAEADPTRQADYPVIALHRFQFEPVPITPAVKRTIKKVCVSRNIFMASRRMGIYVSAMRSMGDTLQTEQGYKDRLEKAIDVKKVVGEILWEQFVERLKRCPGFQYVGPEHRREADAEFVLIVTASGLCQGSVWQSLEFLPVLKVEAILIRNPPFDVDWRIGAAHEHMEEAQNTFHIPWFNLSPKDIQEHPVVWRQYAIWKSQALEQPHATIETYASSPDRFRGAFEWAAQRVADTLLRELEGTPFP